MGMYVAFLRGMNLGRRRVKNEELCECFEDMGFERVSAFLASGNVLFRSTGKSSSTLEVLIEKGLKEWFSYEVRTFVRSAGEVSAAASHSPFDGQQRSASTGKVQVALLSKEPAAASRKQALSLATPDDHLAVEGRELYWLPKANMSASELELEGLAKALGILTIRTQRTLERLVPKLEG